MSQHCWAQHVACVWPPCCDVLRHFGSNLTMVKFEPTTPKMSQHIATRWPNSRNMLRPTMLRYVALACCDRLAGALVTLQSCIQLVVVSRSQSVKYLFIKQILYLHKSHNTPLLPPKILHNHCLQFLLGHEDVTRVV